jgi:alpha-L-fucosidase
MCVRDLERGVQDGISVDPWQTDTCVGDWYYKRQITYKTPTTIIHMLVDIVSKNGNLLLNFPLRADGTLDSAEETIVANLGAWMTANGEAIYGSRPWKRFGEGQNGPAGAMFNEEKLSYTAEDIRFTKKGEALYAFAMAWPASGRLQIRSLAATTPHSIHMLDGGEPLKWRRSPDALVIELPKTRRGDHSFGVRILGVG